MTIGRFSICWLSCSNWKVTRSRPRVDGSEAFDLAISFDPDVVVSDVVMPEVGGLELCRRLKDDPRTAYIPVLLISGRIPAE